MGEKVELEFSDGKKRIYDFPDQEEIDRLRKFSDDLFNQFFPNLDEIINQP